MNKITCICLGVRNMERSMKFYRDGLGFKNPKENVCFSIRSFTDNSYSHGRVNKVLKNIITFDYVNEPGIHIAEKYKSPSLEAVEETVFSKEQFDSAMDYYEIGRASCRERV